MRADMRNEDSVSRTRNPFVSYHALFRMHVVSWVIADSPEIVVRHVISEFRQEALRTGLESDLAFGYMHLQTYFKAFMQHCLKMSDALRMLDIDPNKKNVDGNDKTRQKKELREGPVCLYEPHRSSGIRHLPTDCNICPEEKKKTLVNTKEVFGVHMERVVQSGVPPQ